MAHFDLYGSLIGNKKIELFYLIIYNKGGTLLAIGA